MFYKSTPVTSKYQYLSKYYRKIIPYSTTSNDLFNTTNSKYLTEINIEIELIENCNSYSTISSSLNPLKYSIISNNNRPISSLKSSIIHTGTIFSLRI